MKHLKKICLLGITCTAVIKPINNNLNAAVPSSGERKEIITNYYNFQLLKIIEDSLKHIDPRNSITPELGSYVDGRLFFDIKIYSNAELGDQENVTIGETGRKKNRCISGAFNLANVITPCAYDRHDVYVGVRYIDDKTVQAYFGTIMNVNRPSSPCTAAFAMIN